MNDFWLAPHYISWLLIGFGVTMALSALVSLVASGLGFVICFAKISAYQLFALPAQFFLSVFRNTPLLVQLFFWYFGVSSLLPANFVEWLNTPHVWTLLGIELPWPAFEYIAGFVGLTLYTAAFIAEEIRAGVQGVSTHQRSSALALGLHQQQVWWFIVLPQAIKNAFPSLLGQYMNTIKNTSLTMAIGLAELSYASRQVETETFKTFQAFGIATLLYIAAIIVLEVIGQQVLKSKTFVQGRR